VVKLRGQRTVFRNEEIMIITSCTTVAEKKKLYTVRSELKSTCVRQIWREIYSRALCISEMKSVEGPR